MKTVVSARDHAVRESVRLVAALLLVLPLALTGCAHCPRSCDDADPCTTDECSKATAYACHHDAIVPCSGNHVCEQGEFGQSPDCPNCDDSSPCTSEAYDYTAAKCTHAIVPNCCGNGLCEASEGLYTCLADCRTGLPTLESGQNYRVKLNDRYQFDSRQIRISSIWDGAIVAEIVLDTQVIGNRVDKGATVGVLGTSIHVSDVRFDPDPQRRSAVISVLRSAPGKDG